MSRRERGPWDKTHTVVNYLGVATLVTIIGAIWLVHEAVVSDNAIDSAAVALIGGIVSITTLTIGGLIGMVVGKQMAQQVIDEATEASVSAVAAPKKVVAEVAHK